MNKPTEEIILHDGEEKDARRIACHMREIIKLIGEDPNREGLRKTPERFSSASASITCFRFSAPHTWPTCRISGCWV